LRLSQIAHVSSLYLSERSPSVRLAASMHCVAAILGLFWFLVFVPFLMGIPDLGC